jgi:hypothetical protein
MGLPAFGYELGYRKEVLYFFLIHILQLEKKQVVTMCDIDTIK